MPSEYNYNQVDKYIVSAKLTQPIHVGDGNPEAVLFHPVTRLPFIQAAGIAGAFRGYAEKRDPKATRALFGSGKEDDLELGCLKFTDGVFCSEGNIWPKMELRPHIKIDGETGSVSSGVIKGTSRRAGHKFNMEYIGIGSILQFSVYLFGRKETDDTMKEQLLELFSALHNKGIQFGGKKSNGCGQMQIEKLLWKHFDLTDPEERRLWMEEDRLSESGYEDIKNTLQEMQDDQIAYKVKLFGECDSLLVKCIAVPGTGEDAPDAANIRNAEKEYIVPGSSLKGVIRSRMEQIAGYLATGNPKAAEKYKLLLQNAFGLTGENGTEGKAGNVRFFDAVVGNQEENDLALLQRRIHIDKFTGGVMAGSLFSKKNVSGSIIFEVDVLNRNCPEQICGLLILALRDLALGQINLGSGYSVGKGFIQADRIEVLKVISQEKAVIHIKNQMIQDDSHVLDECLYSLKEESE